MESKLIDVERGEKIHSEDIQNMKKYIKILNRKVKGMQNQMDQVLDENQMLKQKMEFMMNKIN